MWSSFPLPLGNAKTFKCQTRRRAAIYDGLIWGLPVLITRSWLGLAKGRPIFRWHKESGRPFSLHPHTLSHWSPQSLERGAVHPHPDPSSQTPPAAGGSLLRAHTNQQILKGTKHFFSAGDSNPLLCLVFWFFFFSPPAAFNKLMMFVYEVKCT